MQPTPHLAVILLGAGASSRMGRPKLLLPWAGTTVIGRLIAQWRELGAGQIAVVRRLDDTTLGQRLEQEFGRGFGEKNLRRMIQFAEVFPDREIVVLLIRQLTWTHFIALIPLTKPLQRDFYAEIGLILCAGKKQETVELLDPGKAGIHVASYWTKLLPKAQLERKLHQAVRLARAALARRSLTP
jgi:hypothetical protein